MKKYYLLLASLVIMIACGMQRAHATCTPSSTNNPQTICSGGSYTFNGHTYTTAATYRDTLHAIGGCDSIIVTQLTVNTVNTWNGTVNSTWANAGNWSCQAVPTATSNVLISASAANVPILTDARAVADLSMPSGSTIILSGTAAQLSISGAFAGNNGSFAGTGGKVIFNGTAVQTLSGGNYPRLTINNPAGVVLSGGFTANDTLQLLNGIVSLGAYDLWAIVAVKGGSATSYVRTNGTGNFVVGGIGGSNTGTILIPVGNSSYNPVRIKNTGQDDLFTFHVLDSVSQTYSGNTPISPKLTTNTVNRTWLMKESIAGGSNVTLNLEWNAADELPGFARGSSYVAYYSGTWNAGTASAASGSGPYQQAMSGIISFSPFGVGSSGSLPVKLTSFTATTQHADVLLSWTTASELHNDHFTVQRSADDLHFENIGKVQGHGNTHATQGYSYTDASPFTAARPTLYYRLLQEDADGAQDVSAVVSVAAATDHSPVTVWPNPFTDVVRIRLNQSIAGEVRVRIIDNMGKLIAEQQVGKGDVLIDCQALPAPAQAAVYTLQVISSEGIWVQKLVRAK